MIRRISNSSGLIIMMMMFLVRRSSTLLATRARRMNVPASVSSASLFSSTVHEEDLDNALDNLLGDNAPSKETIPTTTKKFTVKALTDEPVCDIRYINELISRQFPFKSQQQMTKSSIGRTLNSSTQPIHDGSKPASVNP